MTTCRLLVPFPPSSNNYWRKTKSGRIYLSEIALLYREVVQGLAAHVNAGKPFRGPVLFQADVFRPRKLGDLGNCEKVLADVLQGLVYDNDSQTVEIHLRRWDHPEFPRVQLLVQELEPAAMPPPWDFRTAHEGRLFVLGDERLRDARATERRRVNARAGKRLKVRVKSGRVTG